LSIKHNNEIALRAVPSIL